MKEEQLIPPTPTDPSPSFPRLLTQKQVAKLIHKSEAWLERKRWEGGGIPYRKVGRHVLYDEADALAYIESYPKQTSTSDGGDA